MIDEHKISTVDEGEGGKEQKKQRHDERVENSFHYFAQMKRIARLLPVFILLSAFTLPAQETGVRGVVTSSAGDTLAGVSVLVPSVHVRATTNAHGGYVVPLTAEGMYILEFRRIGYRTEVREVNYRGVEVMTNVVMNESPFETPMVVVTAEPSPSDVMESPIQTSAVDGRVLDRQRGQAIMSTIDLLPGVTTTSGGPLSVKPVIRGLTAQRVVVAQNGLRLGSQTWDEPQSAELSSFDVERIEVVRGPNSVMFGSDAVGGVVNVIRADVFASTPGTMRGIGIINANSVNGSAGGALGVAGMEGDVAYRVNLNARVASEYNTPNGTVFNSGGQELNGSTSLGLKKEWGTVSLDLSHYNQRYEISPAPGRLEIETDPDTGKPDTVLASPFQEILHERAALTAVIPLDDVRFDVTAAFQYNSRTEEGVKETEEEEAAKRAAGIPPEVVLDLYTTSLNAKMIVANIGTLGVQAEHMRNQTLGKNAVIPSYGQMNLAGFFYSERRFTNDLRATGALRFDTRSMSVLNNTELQVQDTSLSYDAFTGQLGMAWNPVTPMVVAVNLATGWRSPVAAELFGRGQDEGAVRYKVGNASLTPERSVNVDVSIRYNTPAIQAEVSVYRNAINSFIFLQPTGAMIDGLPVYSYLQSDALLVGGEVQVQARITDWLTLMVGADIVRGERVSDASPLPFMPSNRFKGALTYMNNDISWLERFYITVKPRYAMQQDRIAMNETVTPAYFLLDAAIGGQIPVGTSRMNLDVVFENLTNKAYYDALSRYKAYALNPGFNAALKVSVPFSIIGG